MAVALLLIAALAIFTYALVSRVLERSVVSAPILFTALGVLVGPAVLGWVEVSSLGTGTVGVFAEATLVLVLFTDAIRIDIRKLRGDAGIPLRLLSIGLPLTVALGAFVGYTLFESFDLAAAFVLAAILAPTDAALGKAVVASAIVPLRVRQSLNVESGLNDGLMLPVVTVAVTLLAEDAGMIDTSVVGLLASQIGLAVLVAIVIGWSGGHLLDRFASRGLVDGVMRQLATLAIGVGAFAVAEIVGGNGFVAAFVAGIAFGVAARDHCAGAYDFAADEGELLTLVTFLLFGVAVVGRAFDTFSWATVAYVAASLTVVRLVPVAISLIGAGLRLPTILFIGWFGPRGLASILFGVFLLEESGVPINNSIFSVVVLTVLVSVVAHGATAPVLSRRYGTWFNRQDPAGMMEAGEMFEHPIRG
jgi:NhaP-type Na+/H+ or K+/H+ antiporter